MRDRIKLAEGGAAIRESNGSTGFGTFQEIKDGQPIREGVELIQVGEADSDGWREVTSIYRRQKNGPAQVATPAYRDGHDRIFGKQKVGLA